MAAVPAAAEVAVPCAAVPMCGGHAGAAELGTLGGYDVAQERSKVVGRASLLPSPWPGVESGCSRGFQLSPRPYNRTQHDGLSTQGHC